MISFVNAKINIGLQIVSRREDGYHNLQTIFYPVGVYAGTPENPDSFCDIIEIEGRNITQSGCRDRFTLHLSGRMIDCEREKNLVFRAARMYFDSLSQVSFGADIYLDKYLPDGAGMGGGSADAAFTLKMLRDVHCRFAQDGNVPDDDELAEMAVRLGADCPFFLMNRPAYATGIGEILQPVDIDLSGCWLLVVKPVVSVSTKEAFAGIVPRKARFDLRELPSLKLEDWKDVVANDFEPGIFANHPELAEIKQRLYAAGAAYASMTGSGSCIYGIFRSKEIATRARNSFASNPTISNIYLLKM